jgi:hypothetical protein
VPLRVRLGAHVPCRVIERVHLLTGQVHPSPLRYGGPVAGPKQRPNSREEIKSGWRKDYGDREAWFKIEADPKDAVAALVSQSGNKA